MIIMSLSASETCDQLNDVVLDLIHRCWYPDCRHGILASRSDLERSNWVLDPTWDVRDHSVTRVSDRSNLLRERVEDRDTVRRRDVSEKKRMESRNNVTKVRQYIYRVVQGVGWTCGLGRVTILPEFGGSGWVSISDFSFFTDYFLVPKSIWIFEYYIPQLRFYLNCAHSFVACHHFPPGTWAIC